MQDVFQQVEQTPKISKSEFEESLPELRTQLLHAQEELGEAGLSTLILIDGHDLSGCDAAFGRLHEWLDARYLLSHAFGPATLESRHYPWMRRYWMDLPPRGGAGIQMRATGNFLVRQSLRGDQGELRMRSLVKHVRRFEQMLIADGTVLIKFWLHVSKKALSDRLKDADKKGDWTIQPEEPELHRDYDDAIPVVAEVLDATEIPNAPWVIVDGADARTRDMTIAREILRVLQERIAIQRAEKGQEPRPPQRLDEDPVTVLDRVDLSKTIEYERYDKEKKKLQAKLGKLHREATEKGVGMVLVFEGWDAAGKGGVIRRLCKGMDATRYRIFPIAAPDQRELSRHWLWRFWRRLPPDGRTSIFDRSWYGRVLVERVEGFAQRAEWQRAYADIEDFETQLIEHGYVVCKFWLHIDREEQARRFEQRKGISFKRYKITPEDWRNRERWRDYEAAVEDMVARTDGAVPWTLVPSNDKRYARIEVLKTVCKALERRLAAVK